jgi:hypothetical protein
LLGARLRAAPRRRSSPLWLELIFVPLEPEDNALRAESSETSCEEEDGGEVRLLIARRFDEKTKEKQTNEVFNTTTRRRQHVIHDPNARLRMLSPRRRRPT